MAEPNPSSLPWEVLPGGSLRVSTGIAPDGTSHLDELQTCSEKNQAWKSDESHTVQTHPGWLLCLGHVASTSNSLQAVDGGCSPGINSNRSLLDLAGFILHDCTPMFTQSFLELQRGVTSMLHCVQDISRSNRILASP